MDKALLDLLVDPVGGAPLRLEASQVSDDGEILEGLLHGEGGRTYQIRDSIPRFLGSADSGQRQTEVSFGFKWQQTSTYDSPAMHARSQEWLVQRYGFTDVSAFRRYLAKSERMLDAGCGSGFSASLWMDEAEGGTKWFGADISQAIDVARRRIGAIPGTHFLQVDLMNLPFGPETFDVIFSEGVLHHTPSTEAALKTLTRLLAVGGELMFYVYRKKGPVREFTDDYVRGVLASLSPEQAWEMLRSLTRLGQALSELRAEVEVPEDVPLLGIKAGHYDVQRLIYWNFAKLFWNAEFSFDENHHINFDWYHPSYAHRQTEEDVRRWCSEAGLSIHHFNTQESGFTVRAMRQQ